MKLRTPKQMLLTMMGAWLLSLGPIAPAALADPCPQENSSASPSVSPELQRTLKKIDALLGPIAECDDCNGTGTRGGGQFVFVPGQGIRFLDMLTDQQLAQAVPLAGHVPAYSEKCDSTSIRKFGLSSEQKEVLDQRLKRLESTAPEVSAILRPQLEAVVAKSFASNYDFGRNFTDGWRQSARVSPDQQETLAFYAGNLLVLREPPIAQMNPGDLLPALSHEAFRQFSGGSLTGNGAPLSVEQIEKATAALWRDQDDSVLAELFELEKGRAFMSELNSLVEEAQEALQAHDPEKTEALFRRIHAVFGPAVGDSPLPAWASSPKVPLWLAVQIQYPKNARSLIALHRLYEPLLDLSIQAPPGSVSFAAGSALTHMELILEDQASQMRIQAAARKAYEDGAKVIEEALANGHTGSTCLLFLETIRRQPSQGAGR